MSQIEAEIRQLYSAIRRGISDGTPATVLHIGAEQTAVATGIDSQPAALLVLAIGAQKTAADYFKHGPPTPGEMENAIIAVEDEIARARAVIAGGTPLFAADTILRDIALAAGIPDRPPLIMTREAVEVTFERLVSTISGRPASRAAIPASAAFATTLLILREFMHHLQFSSITVIT
jgi:exopolyphosphatase/pppGpp-phosphohydrolase